MTVNMAPSAITATNDSSPQQSSEASFLSQARVRFLQQSYDPADSEESARKLIFTLRPEWATDSTVEFVRFTDGITNTLLKAVNKRPGLSKAEIDRDAILLRAYGNGTDVLIDREREAANHELLMNHGLAPELLARFQNGMLYRFVAGHVATAKDLQHPEVLTAVARRLAQWHASLPCLTEATVHAHSHANDHHAGQNGNEGLNSIKSKIANAAPGKPVPNVWTTMQKWILALPTETQAQRERQSGLQTELEVLVKKLSQRPGYGNNGLVFAHCDLLCANIIMHRTGPTVDSVSFIDYEYGTPSPAAFDIANHFAEWAGYDCDYAAVPTISQRHMFIAEYVKTYLRLSGLEGDQEEETRKLMHEVDIYRGVPGFYWGIWSLIQSTISHIDFDYAEYAEERLGEYWAFKAEDDGSREKSGKDMPLREKTWAKEG